MTVLWNPQRWKHEWVLKWLGNPSYPHNVHYSEWTPGKILKIDRVYLCNSHFLFFIDFIFSTLSGNQTLPAGLWLLLLTGLGLFLDLSFTPWYDWLSKLYLSPSPLIPCLKVIHLCHLLHYTFSQGIFIWNLLLLMMMIKWKYLSPVKGISENWDNFGKTRKFPTFTPFNVSF